MRRLEKEREVMRARQEAENRQREAEWREAKKAEERQRQLEVDAAQRDVAATFKLTREKELADRTAREAAEKARFAAIAKRERQKIDLENRRRVEAERQAAELLRELKSTQ